MIAHPPVSVASLLFPAFVIIAGLSKTAVSSADEIAGLPFVEGSTTLAVLPDTQYYSLRYPRHFEAQTEWIARRFRERHIVYTLHLGDVVQNDAPSEWDVAKRCMGMLDGKVPYLLIPGNHDYSGGTRKSRMTEYFSVGEFRQWPTFGGLYDPDRLDNNYHLFDIGDQKWIALGLEYGPRKKVMEWANKVLLRHRDRRAIVVTHGYLFYDNQRYDHRMGKQRATPYGYAGDGADGEQLWNSVIRRHPNVMITICGHVRTGGLGYAASEGDYGNIVHEMMANYQKMRGGGLGFMRLLEFSPDGKTVQVRTFSPFTREIRNSKLEQFSFQLQPATRDTPKPVGPGSPAPLRRGPVHRYSFDGDGGDTTLLKDSIGGVAGEIRSPEGMARLNGAGQFVIDGNDAKGELATISVKLIKGRSAVTMEVWVTPTASHYDWDSVVHFGDSSDAFYYAFRTLQKHRAELIDDRHNEDIQRTIPVKPGVPLHIVMAYDEAGADGKPEITSYIDGEMTGRMQTSIKLSELPLKDARIGPFAGVYEELRFFDYALSPEEVKNNFQSGPDRLSVKTVVP